MGVTRRGFLRRLAAALVALAVHGPAKGHEVRRGWILRQDDA